MTVASVLHFAHERVERLEGACVALRMEPSAGAPDLPVRADLPCQLFADIVRMLQVILAGWRVGGLRWLMSVEQPLPALALRY